jgi:hypothetical protein
MKKFWYVLVPGGGAPWFRHSSEFRARKEAERLVRTGLARRALVLAYVGQMTKLANSAWHWERVGGDKEAEGDEDREGHY